MKVARTVDLEPIDRLEEKVKRLVDLINRLRSDLARAAEENHRLSRDMETLRARAAEADGVAAEIGAMREERDVIRTRVSEMLDQLEALNL